MTQADLENAKLEQIASEYRRKGYDVAIRPREDHIPAFLRPFQPDLVATSDGDNVVVEIKSSPELASESIVKLAEAIEAQSGWRFELVVVNPPVAREVPPHGALAADDRVESILREAQALYRERRYEAAAMMAWSAAEAIFRRVAEANGLEAERKSSASVLKQLYASGLIDEDQYEVFSRTMEFRNAFAHGFTASVAPETIDRFMHDVEELKSRPAA
jgi:uncharacterized protein YutE (UPF0331/DUF86 family)